MPIFKIGGPDLMKLYASPLPRGRLAEFPAEARQAYREETGERKWYITPTKRNKLRITKAVILALAECPECLDCTVPRHLKKLRARVAHHLTEDLLGEKRSSRRKLLPLEAGAELSIDPMVELEVRLHFEELSRKLNAELTPRESELYHVMCEGLNVTEAAARLGVTRSTADNLLSRIRKKVSAL